MKFIKKTFEKKSSAVSPLMGELFLLAIALVIAGVLFTWASYFQSGNLNQGQDATKTMISYSQESNYIKIKSISSEGIILIENESSNQNFTITGIDINNSSQSISQTTIPAGQINSIKINYTFFPGQSYDIKITTKNTVKEFSIALEAQDTFKTQSMTSSGGGIYLDGSQVDLNIIFDAGDVSTDCNTVIQEAGTGYALSNSLTPIFQIVSNCSLNSSVTLRFYYNESNVANENSIRVYKFISGGWVDQNATLNSTGNYLDLNVTSFSVFAVKASTELELQNISASPAGNSAIISWTTNLDANSFVDYGLTTSYGSTSNSATYEKSHSRSLTGLSSNTAYHYRIKSCQSNLICKTSIDYNFTTTAGEPIYFTETFSNDENISLSDSNAKLDSANSLARLDNNQFLDYLDDEKKAKALPISVFTPSVVFDPDFNRIFSFGGGLGDYETCVQNVYYGNVGSDNNITQWNALANLSGPWCQGKGLIDNDKNRIYLIGGNNNGGVNNRMYYFDLNSEGLLGTEKITLVSYLNASVTKGAAIANSIMYFKPNLATNGTVYSREVLTGVIQSDGNITSWASNVNNWLPNGDGNVVNTSFIIDNNYLYAIGGDPSGVTSNKVLFAKINSDGNLGNWQYGANLPSESLNAYPVAINNNIYIFGRNDSTNDWDNIYRGPINKSDGNITYWETLTNPEGMAWDFGLTASSNALYKIGGGWGDTTAMNPDVNYFKVNSNAYFTNNQLTSKSINLGTVTSYSSINWSATTPGNTDVNVMLRTSDNNVTWSNWTNYATSGLSITNDANDWIQFKVVFSTDVNSSTPTITDFNIAYYG